MVTPQCTVCMYRVRTRSSPGPGAGAAREEAAECSDGAIGRSADSGAISRRITCGRIDDSIDDEYFSALRQLLRVILLFKHSATHAIQLFSGSQTG